LFIFDGDFIYGVEPKKKRFFARSFANISWNDFYEEYLGDNKAEFGIDFAWSCNTCLIVGYPQQKGNEACVTLDWACKEFNVEVTIESEEDGECFEEEIEADKHGVRYICKDMPYYRCVCGNKQQLPSDACIEDETCWECDEEGKFTLIPSEN